MADPFTQFTGKKASLDTPIMDPYVAAKRRPTLTGGPSTVGQMPIASTGAQETLPPDVGDELLTAYEGAPPISRQRLYNALQQLEGLDFDSANRLAGTNQDLAVALNFYRTQKPDWIAAHASENNYGLGANNAVTSTTPTVTAGPSGWNDLLSRAGLETVTSPIGTGPIAYAGGPTALPTASLSAPQSTQQPLQIHQPQQPAVTPAVSNPQQAGDPWKAFTSPQGALQGTKPAGPAASAGQAWWEPQNANGTQTGQYAKTRPQGQSSWFGGVTNNRNPKPKTIAQTGSQFWGV